MTNHRHSRRRSSVGEDIRTRMVEAMERVEADLAWADKHGDMGRCMFADADDIRTLLAALRSQGIKGDE